MMHGLTFDRPFNGLLRVENILLDELERSRSMTELIVELVGQPGLLQHTLPLGQARVHVTHILEDVLPDQLLPARPLLDLRLQQVAGLRPLQLLALLMERWRRLQSCDNKNRCSLMPESGTMIHLIVSGGCKGTPFYASRLNISPIVSEWALRSRQNSRGVFLSVSRCVSQTSNSRVGLIFPVNFKSFDSWWS